MAGTDTLSTVNLFPSREIFSLISAAFAMRTRQLLTQSLGRLRRKAGIMSLYFLYESDALVFSCLIP